MYTLLPFFLYILPRRSSRTSTWLGQPSAWVRFYNEICKSQTFQCTPFFTNRCTICPIYHIFIVAGNFVGVLGVLALQYLKTMPLQLINRLITEAFSYFPSFRGSMTLPNVCLSCILIDSICLVYCYHRSSKQDASIFAAAGDACAYCWDVVCIFLR